MVKNVSSLTQNSQLHAIIEAAVEGIISINKEGIIQSYNPAAEKIFQYSAKEVIGQNVKMLMPAPYKEQHDRYINNYVAGGQAKIIGKGREVSGLRKDGSVFPMWLAVAEFQENKQKFFTGFIRDLTNEKAFYQQASSYDQILEHSINEIYVFDAKTLHFIRANQGALTNLQYSKEEMLKLTPLDLKPEYTLEKFEALIKPLRENLVGKVDFTTVHCRKDGTYYPVEVHLELTEYESKQAFVAIILDITKRVEAQEKARINQERLAHMDRVSIFGQMAAGIAHELNQPLTAIGSYADAGKRRVEFNNFDQDKLKELFDKISALTHRADGVISSLRMMLKPHEKKTDYVDINQLISEALKLARSDRRAIDYQINLHLEKELPQIVADNIQIQQVILNLLSNAMDAAKNEKKENKVIEIHTKLLSPDNRIQVSIRDYGTGVDIQNTDQLFNPFYTTKDNGMGIGLAICQSIIQEHSGKLWFSNNDDKGATFSFRLPTVLEDDEHN